MNDITTVSVILVNFNTAKLTLNAIQSIYDYTNNINIEIIVVDNNSNDNSVELIKNKFPLVSIIRNKKNIGFGRANNKGMEMAKGKYYFLLNTDTYLLNNAIEILYKFMENPLNNNVAVVGGKLVKPDGSYCVSDARFPNFKLFVKGSFLKYFFKKSYYNNEYYIPIKSDESNPYETDYVSGADFFIRKEIVDLVGGFDKRFFLYAEEAELSFRIKKIIPNVTCMINQSAKIVHISQGSQSDLLINKKKKIRFIKGRSIYFRITKGFLFGVLYYLISIKRLYFNKV